MRMAAGPSPAATVEERIVAGAEESLAARLYVPEARSQTLQPGLVYFHGGGLVAGSLDTHDGLCRTLADAAGCRVVSVDYRLAPEHPFPAAVEDACAATAWIAVNADSFGIDVARLAVGGDSGGGTLAAVVCHWARDRGAPQIALQLLLCPVLDFAEISASRRTYARGYLLDQATMDSDLAHYLDKRTNLDDPRVSPLRAANLGGLPPALIHTAEFDPLRDEGAAYAARLVAAGVRVRHTCHAGLIHHFYGMTGLIPLARTAVAEIGAELSAALR
jgi:acetyl esterase/lipase